MAPHYQASQLKSSFYWAQIGASRPLLEPPTDKVHTCRPYRDYRIFLPDDSLILQCWKKTHLSYYLKLHGGQIIRKNVQQVIFPRSRSLHTVLLHNSSIALQYSSRSRLAPLSSSTSSSRRLQSSPRVSLGDNLFTITTTKKSFLKFKIIALCKSAIFWYVLISFFFRIFSDICQAIKKCRRPTSNTTKQVFVWQTCVFPSKKSSHIFE